MPEVIVEELREKLLMQCLQLASLDVADGQKAMPNDNSFTPPFAPSVVTFSNMNEDYQVELESLQILRESGLDLSCGIHVVCVASSGETALALLNETDVVSVDAGDLSAWQVWLCELRRTALLHLTRDEQLRLTGMDPRFDRAHDRAERLRLYRSIREHLPEEVRKQWDSRLEYEIAFGIGHCGQSDIINHDLQACLSESSVSPVGHDDVQTLLHDEAFLNCWRRVYSYANFSRRFATLHIDQHGMNEMIARHLRVLGRPGISHSEENYFFHYYYTNYFGRTEIGKPLFLQNQAQARILELGAGDERLRFHVKDIVELANQNGPATNHMVSMSNIIDWITEQDAIRMLDDISESLVVGGAILVRHETHQADYLSKLARKTRCLQIDSKANARVMRCDRALLTRDIALFFKVAARDGAAPLDHDQ